MPVKLNIIQKYISNNLQITCASLIKNYLNFC